MLDLLTYIKHKSKRESTVPTLFSKLKFEDILVKINTPKMSEIVKQNFMTS